MEAAQSMSQPPSPSGSVRSIRSVPRAEPSAKELREMLENPIAEGTGKVGSSRNRSIASIGKLDASNLEPN